MYVIIFPPEMKLNLFDLNEENHKFEETTKKDKPESNVMDKFIFSIASSLLPDDILSEEDMDKMFENIMTQVNNKESQQRPSIDDILDKIQEMGIDSLTNFEKQILDEYKRLIWFQPTLSIKMRYNFISKTFVKLR